MDHIIKFLNDSYIKEVIEHNGGYKCLFTQEGDNTNDGEIYFEFSKRGWLKKPIQSKQKYIMVDANMVKVLSFLNSKYNLNESDYVSVKIIIDIAMDEMNKI